MAAAAQQPPTRRGRGAEAVELKFQRDQEDYRPALMRQLRAALRDGQLGSSLSDLELGAALRVNRLMFALASEAFRRTEGQCVEAMSALVAGASAEALGRVRELVHFGRADFGRDRKSFYEAFHLIEALELKECHEACCTAVLASWAAEAIVVELTPQHELALASRLQDMFSAYPGHITPTFDVHFVPPGAQLPCMRAHSLVLAAVSDYFRALMVQGHALESEVPRTISTQDVNQEVLAAALDFAYLGAAHVTEQHCKALALQADGWQLTELVKACCEAVLERPELARRMLQEGVLLPSVLQIAVAYSIPEAVAEDGDVTSFLAFIGNAELAWHVSHSAGHFTIREAHFDDDGPCSWLYFRKVDSSFLPRTWEAPAEFEERACLRLISRDDLRTAYGRGEGRGLIGSQLEAFIAGEGFSRFLEHPGALRLPLRSAAMVIESFFVQLTDFHPQHPRHSKKGLGKGKRPEPEERGFEPCGWRLRSEQVADWCIRWAAAQPLTETATSVGGVGVSPQLYHLVGLRGSIRHAHSTYQGARAFQEFWARVFFRAAMAHSVDAIDLVAHSDQHFAEPCLSEEPPARGGYNCSWHRQFDKEVYQWTTAHPLYEAAFRAAARLTMSGAGTPEMFGRKPHDTEPELSWCGSLSSAALVRLLACEEASNLDAMKRVLRSWLLNGEAAGPKGIATRAMELAVQVSKIEGVLRYPLSSNKAPRFLRYTLKPKAALNRISSIMSGLLTDGLFAS